MSKTLSNTQLERLIGLVAIGLSVALEEDHLSPDEAAHLLFSPATMRLLEGQDADRSLVSLVHDGTEVDDVSRLAPEGLSPLLAKIRKAGLATLKTADTYDFQETKWLEILLSPDP